MISPEFTITSNENKVILAFEDLPKHLKARLRGRITVLTQRLLAQVQAAEPSRTGRLRALTKARIDEPGDKILGRVFVAGDRGTGHNIAAAALEYGQQRTVRVRAHTERRTTVFGHQITPESVPIKAHPRRPHIAARRFLRGPLETLRPVIIAELQAALNDALADTQKEMSHV